MYPKIRARDSKEIAQAFFIIPGESWIIWIYLRQEGEAGDQALSCGGSGAGAEVPRILRAVVGEDDGD